MSIEEHSKRDVNSWEEPFWKPNEIDYEPLKQYDHGGYCPVLIWQRFDNDRYRIVYKLGCGAFSTVWLAQDLQKKCYVALKILTADQYDQSSEADMLRAIANSGQSSPEGQNYIIPLLDSFEYESANGKHHILVFPVCRPLTGRRWSKMDFPAMAKSLVKGLDYLHATGIIHGDIHIGNVGYQIQNFSEAQLQQMEPPQLYGVPPLNGKRPPYLVSRTEWPEETFLDQNHHGHVIPQFIDFGAGESATRRSKFADAYVWKRLLAFKISEKEARLGKLVAVPEYYVPPEHVFDPPESTFEGGLNCGELSKETDIWALGATLYELVTGEYLLIPRWGSTMWKPYLSFDDRVPPGWQWIVDDVRKRDALSENAVVKFWEEAFQTIEKCPVSVGDKELFKRFILDMVCLDPARRLSTSALLQHEYLADVA